MKMNMIISKRHIILSALVLALSVAVYLNWEYVNTNGAFLESDKLAVNGEMILDNSLDDEDLAQTAAYGEAYFAEAKLSRTKSRDEAMDALKYMLSDANLNSEQLTKLTLQATAIAKNIETEGKIENLIKAKGFAECMVYLESDKIDVLVKCPGMTDAEAAQIKDVILGEVNIPNEKISIIEIK